MKCASYLVLILLSVTYNVFKNIFITTGFT